MVTLSGSPPKAAMLFCTHVNASLASHRPKLPGQDSSPGSVRKQQYNFHSLEGVDRVSETQLQMGENYSLDADIFTHLNNAGLFAYFKLHLHCYCNVGPASQMVDQHYDNIGLPIKGFLLTTPGLNNVVGLSS